MNEETLFDKNDVTQIPVNEGAGPRMNETGNPFQDDETRMEDYAVPQEPNSSQEESLGAGWEVEPEKKYKIKLPKNFGKKAAAVVGGLGGVVGLAAKTKSLLKPMNLFPDEDGEMVDPIDAEPAPEFDEASAPQIEPHDMDLATSVDDDMSFGEAFAAARHEVGPGGLFVWHGHTYGTYYGSEWNAMSPEDQEQYWANVHHTVSQIEIEPVEEDLDTDVNVEDQLADQGELAENETETPEEGEAVETSEPVEAVVEVEAEPLTDSDLPTAEVEVVEAEPIAEGEMASVEVEVVETEPVAEGEMASVEVEVPEAEPVAEGEMASVEVEVVEAEPSAEVELDLGEEPIDIVDDVPQVEDDFTGINPDVDDMAVIDLDPNIPIDNDMDMGDFV